MCAKTTSKKKHERVINSFIVVSLIVFFVLTCSKTPLQFERKPHDYYVELSQSLLSGRIDLAEPSSPVDLSIYEGKYYLPWGVMPSIVLAPLVLLFGASVNGIIVSCILGVFSIPVWFGVYQNLKKRGVLKLTSLELFLFTALSVFGTDFFWSSTRGMVWHMSQTFAFFFISLSLFFMFRKSTTSKILSSVFFSCAFLTRNGLILVSPVFYLALVYVHKKDAGSQSKHPTDRRTVNRILLLILLPFVFSVFFNGAYNYARFENPFESGYTHQNLQERFVNDFKNHGLFSVHYLRHNINIYFQHPVKYKLSRPYLEFDDLGNSMWSYQLSLFIVALALSIFILKKTIECELRFSSIARELKTGYAPVFLLFSLMWVLYHIPLMFFLATGDPQFGTRYLLEVQPFLSLVIVFSFSYLRKKIPLRLVSYLLIVLTILIQC